jgi:hypothetical protein
MLNVYSKFDKAKTLPGYGSDNHIDLIVADLRNEIMDGDPEDEYTQPSHITKELQPKVEAGILNDPNFACAYALKKWERWPEFEAKYKSWRYWHPANSYAYAQGLIKGRWLSAESSIKKDPRYAYEYAKNILAKDPKWLSKPNHENGRWPEAEEYIKRDASQWIKYVRDVHEDKEYDPGAALLKNIDDLRGGPKTYEIVDYAKDVLKGRWLEAEKVIIDRPFQAWMYAYKILSKDAKWKSEPDHENGRWPEAEQYIMKDASASSGYARHIIKGTWASIGKPEAEEILMQNAELARYYARDIMKKRWLEAEPIIKRDGGYHWDEYKNHFGIE